MSPVSAIEKSKVKLNETSDGCVTSLTHLSVEDQINQLPQQKRFQKIEDDVLFNDLMKNRSKSDLAKLTDSFTLLILSRMRAYDITPRSNDFADLFQELYLKTTEYLESFDQSKIKNPSKALQADVFGYLKANLTRQILHYFKPLPPPIEVNVARERDRIRAIRKYDWLVFESSTILSDANEPEEVSVLERYPNPSDGADGIQEKAFIEEFGKFVEALKTKFSANSPAFQGREAIIVLQWFKGDDNLAEQVGLHFKTPNKVFRETQHKTVAWTIREIAEFTPYGHSQIANIKKDLAEDFKHFLDRGELLPLKERFDLNQHVQKTTQTPQTSE